MAFIFALAGPPVIFFDAASARTGAGTVIPNIASTTCSVSGSQYKQDSNNVLVTVVQLNQLVLGPSKSVALLPGVSVSDLHTVTNQGNVPDTVNLEATSLLGFTVQFFAADGVTPLSDSNGDGKVDTGPIASGASVNFIAKLTAPESAPPGEVEQTVIKASSTGNPSVVALLTDSERILKPWVWDPLTKTVSPSGQVTQGSLLTYTFSFGNGGGADATNTIISDRLDPNLLYVEGSALLPPGLSRSVSAYDPATRTVTWTIPSIPAGSVGSVSFQARVDPATPSDTSISDNSSIVSDQIPAVHLFNKVSTPVVEQPLRISKHASKTEAEIGDSVKYIVIVENVSKALSANHVTVVDALPLGFRYLKGSTLIDGAAAPEPAGGTTLTWDLGTLEPGKKRELDYLTLVSIDAPLGEGVNSALAIGTSPAGNSLFSLPVYAKVKTLEGVLNSKATILGRVFVDLNGDLMPDENEPGLKSVRLYLEDGSYVLTDGEGKFNFNGVAPGEHVLKIDKSSLPAGYAPVALDGSFAGDGNSRFVSVPYGGMGRGDFGLKTAQKAPSPPREQPEPAREERVYTFGAQLNPGPRSLEQQIDTMPDAPEILEPARGALLRKSWSDIVIRVPDGASYVLRVNDVPLLQKQIGKTIVEKKRKIRICQFVGVKLNAGANKIELEVTRRPGGEPEVKLIEVVAPGEAVQVVLSPDKAEIPADGKTVLPFTVSFLDKMNNPVIGEVIFTVLTEKGEVLDKDLDPAKPGHQLKAVDGKGSFKLRSTLKTGAERIVVDAGTKLTAGVDLFFSPELRDWIVVGLGSLTVGSNSVSGHVEQITKDDRFQEGIYEDGRLAFFAKGKVLGQYLLTAAYDSQKKERNDLFQRVEPDRYYPIYGDASLKGYDAESQKKYYLKIEKDRSSLLVGDFHTKLSENEFSRYDRTFNGVKADIDTKHATLRAFGTSTNHSANKDEIPGNGTSGYYFLTKKPILENTDKIRIEVRDRYHTERVLTVAEKAPYTDYSLDYRTGAILFREPVPSFDGNLNPVRIVALYESEDPGDDNYLYGGRGALRSDKGSEVGVTAVVEQKGAGSNALYGIDGTLVVSDKTKLKMEAARSDTLEKGSGLAWKAELSTRLEKAMIDAYYRQVDRNFHNISMTGGEGGSQKYGAKMTYSLLEKTKLIAEGFVQSDLMSGTKLTSTSLGVSHQMERIKLDTGYRFLQGDDGTGKTTSAQMLFAGVSGKLTEKLEGSIMQEQAFTRATVKDYPSRTLLKLNYKLTEKTSAFVTEELQESGVNRKNSTIFGVTSKLRDNVILSSNYQEATGADRSRQIGTEVSSKWAPSKELSFTTKTGYQVQNSLTGDRGQALMGVDSSWEAMKGVKIGAKAERVQLVTGTNDPAGVNTALALSAEYLAREDLKTTGRYEFRLSPNETTHLYGVSGAWKLTKDFSLLGKGTLWSSAKAAGTDLLFDGEVGGAYRPLGRNSLYLLGVVRFKDDSKGSTPAGDEVKSLIGSGEFSERLRPNLTLHGKYAGKYSWETTSGQQSRSYTDMMLAGGTYDLTDHWDMGLSAKLMTQYGTGMRSLGFIPQAGYRVYRNTRLAVGYNFSRLNDRDLAGEGYSASGPFVQIKFKFDEMTIEDLYLKVTSSPRAVPIALLPPPAPKPVTVILKAALAEEPVEVLGSVEALKLLVNDRETIFQAGDIKIRTESADEVIELKGNELDKPLEFQVEVASPEKIVSWALAVVTLQGDLHHLIRGKGAPKALIAWDGRNDRNEPLKGGEIYRYRLEVEYARGSRVTSPFRSFGINRSSAVAMSLTGGAFETGSANLSRKARVILKDTAVVLRRYAKEKIVVEGHTDSVGTDAANLELSRKRSQAAADYLINVEKIPAQRIVVRWFGKSRPVVSNAIPEGRELNRRVEVKGEFQEVKRAELLDQRREPPFVRINRSAVPIDEFGRFSRLLTEKSELVEIEMGNSSGRSVTTTLALPNLLLIEPAGGEARVVVPNKGTDVQPPPQLSISYQFVGTTMAGATLTLDGKEVPVAKDGSFSFTLDLAEGEATYWLQVRSPEGYGKQVRLTVSVAPEDGPTKPPGPGSGKVLLGEVASKLSPKKGVAPRGAKVSSKNPTPALPAVAPVASVAPVVPVTPVTPVVPVTAVLPVTTPVTPVVMHLAKRAEAAPTEKAIVNPAPPETAAKVGDTAETGRYSLKIGEYVLAAAMAEAKKKIKLAGLQPEVKPGPKMKEPMIRLLVSEFPDQNAAKKMLARLHNAKADGFALTSSRGCFVYAGSYSGQEGAERERTRLAALGIKVSLKKLQVSVPVQLLFAGSYATREEAWQGAAKLEQLGLKSAVVESGIEPERKGSP